MVWQLHQRIVAGGADAARLTALSARHERVVEEIFGARVQRQQNPFALEQGTHLFTPRGAERGIAARKLGASVRARGDRLIA